MPATLAAIEHHPGLHGILVGRRSVIDPFLTGADSAVARRIQVRDSPEVVEMHDHPLQALRSKKQSSMRVAIDLVKNGEAMACVSAGNTGALMATARFVLKTLPGIERPAILSQVPSVTGHTHMLDLGANADCTAEQLFQFAVMGSVVASDLEELAEPTVGLLNIGVEEVKGNETIQEAGRMLSGSKLNYVGFVEGSDIFSGAVDVVVADGFSGNVALKSAEGTAKMITEFIQEEFSHGWLRRLTAVVALPVLKALRTRLDPRHYNGASLVGLSGIVIKSHGGADRLAFENAIRTALVEVENGVPHQIGLALEEQ